MPDEFDRYLKTRWDSIKRRCEDPTSKHYARYGGRGIKLSDEFQDPRVFVAYVKSLPNASPELEIDRRDNNRGYERGNLRWVDHKTNVNNQERSIWVEYQGKRLPFADFVKNHTDLSYQFSLRLLHEGKTTDELANWVKETCMVTYGGQEMSFRQFALKFTTLDYNYAKQLYDKGHTLDEIVNWQRRSDRITYNGKTMSLRSFVKKHTKLSVRHAYTLYSKGATLEELVAWKNHNPEVVYNGEELSFPDFVKKYTSVSYSYAVHLRSKGKSLDEIARWKITRTRVRPDQRGSEPPVCDK